MGVCPLCYIPPAVAGLWGSALITAPGVQDGCEQCQAKEEVAKQGAALSAALGIAGSLPLGYLGLRRWRGGRHGLAAGCLASSSMVLAFCGQRLVWSFGGPVQKVVGW
ncbi:unnamed protein product [Durusdinium trenchii]|uniref:Uncharacterized protein n=1 Tax=Durusdinium trenchii TaxID=1381693 RepID=A0ABP0QWX5_9DINO